MDAYRPLPGTKTMDLDTPCLLVDLDALEHNYDVIAATYKDTSTKMRQHTKNIKSPVLARMQIDAGGTMGGICAAKVAEAEIMLSAGITDILIANQIVDREKIIRLCALNRHGDVKVCIDSESNVRYLSEIAQQQGVEIGVLIEVETNMKRSGVRSKEQGVDLAKVANDLPGVKFLGVMSHQHLEKFIDEENRILLATEYYDVCLSVKTAIENAGIPVHIISSGETFSYDAALTSGETLEVEGGTYALMGTMYGYMKEFRIANKILSTIVSKPSSSIAIADVGSRALSIVPGGSPTVEDMPGVMVDQIYDNHIVLKMDETTSLEVNDKISILPFYQDMLVNRWDQYIAVRDGVVEDVWDILARGCYH